MAYSNRFLLLLKIFICCSTQIYGQQGPLVSVGTTRGKVVGFHFDQGSDTNQLYYGQADVFLGLPYAQPPVGQLRFAKPQRINKFTEDPYNATYVRKECPQGAFNAGEMSEDCLYLNIYTPNATSITKYPVMVWIHGGGLLGGNNRLNIPGVVRNLVSRGVVVVSIQYRLGFLGFYTTYTDDFPANVGMLDQVETLRFVQEEISNFGGDPNKVTIFGESAGSASVSAHTYSPLSQNLFHHAIQESGTVLTCFEGALGPTYQYFRFADRACNYTAELWNSGNYTNLKNCLMNLDVAVGLQKISAGGNAVCWNMVQDNNFFPGIPRTLWMNRTNKPNIIGTNKDEWGVWELRKTNQPINYTKNFTENEILNKFANLLNINNQAQQAIEAMENIYLSQGSNTSDDQHLEWISFAVAAGTSFFFTGSAGSEAEYHILNNNSNLYMYEFTYASNINGDKYKSAEYNPVVHGSELHYVFMEDTTWLPAQNKSEINATDIAIANFFGEAWTNFAKTGQPSLGWQNTQSTGVTEMEYFEIGANRGMRNGYRSLDRIQFNRVLPLFVGTLPPDVPDYNNGSIVPLPNNQCQNGWYKETTNANKCLKFVIEPNSLIGANFYCGKLGANSSLLSIDNSFENSEIYQQANIQGCNQFYIGLFHNGNTWAWYNGDSSNYQNWKTGYPNNDNTQDCVTFETSSGKWYNSDCDTSQCYICQQFI